MADGRDGRDGKRGPPGIQGPVGPKPAHEWDDTKIRFQTESGWGDWIDLRGFPGLDGKDGADGQDGKDVDIELVIQFIKDEIEKIPKPRNGRNGKDGVNGTDGKRGLRGLKGDRGDKGERGYSAYEIWLQEGHEGTEEDFLEWLIRRVIALLKEQGLIGIGGGSGSVRLEGGFGFVIQSTTALTTGIKGFIPVPYNMRITGWTLLADASGSAQVDIWVSSYADAFPDNSDSITGGNEPVITASNKGKSLDVSGWNVNIRKGDVMVFNVDSVSEIKMLTLGINGVRK